MKFYDIHEINEQGRPGELIKSATAEQLEEFKKKNQGAEICENRNKYDIRSYAGWDYCVFSYESKIIYAIETKTQDDPEKWEKLTSRKTKGAAEKVINQILKQYINDVATYENARKRWRIVGRYQTIDEAI